MSVYASSARFDGSARELSEVELRDVAPSIFAVTAHESRSDRFAPIPTFEILKGLRKEGFSVVGAKQAVTRVAGKADYTKHLIRLRRLDDAQKFTVGDTVFEMLLKNANDGTSAYDLLAGLFRIACLNSLVSQTSTLDSVRVRHSGDVMTKVIEGTYRVLGEAERALSAPADWSAVALSSDERHALAESAHVLRFGDIDGNTTTPVKPEQLLRSRRIEDRGTDLWSTFNVVQENVIKGGVSAHGRDANNRHFRRTTRAVNGIDADVKLNKALWILAERMKEIKSVAAAA